MKSSGRCAACILLIVFLPLISMPAGASPPSSPVGASLDTSVLREATDHFRAGRYDAALRLFQQANGGERVAGVIGASRTWMMTGDYTAAEQLCRDTITALPDALPVTCQLADILTLTGRADEALSTLQPVVQGAAPPPRCLVQYGDLLRLRGRHAAAVDSYQRVLTAYHDGRLVEAEDIAMAALASWALGRFHDANRLFREATQLDPKNFEAQVLWGDLFLAKYNHAEARKSYTEVLEQNDRYVPALVGLAKTLHGRDALQQLEAALAINWRYAPALEAMAELSLEDDDFATARDYLARLLALNPESVSVQAMRAALAHLEADDDTFATLRQAVEQFSPGNGHFYARIAELHGRKYRFKEAVALARQALRADPQDAHSHTILGMNLLRLGYEAEGRAHLEQAFDRDPFNFRTVNMLRVLDVLAQFETRRSAHFTVRLHPAEADVLWPYLEPLLEESWNTLSTKYGFVPASPIVVEVYREHEDFAVRTAGLPDIGPLIGVCFGKVITLDSPRALQPPRTLNWQEIVWHEFAHVITLQMTDNRLPRWLSEGISVYEEAQARPEWGRQQELELVRAVQDNRILPLAHLNAGFSKADSAQALGWAYYQSYLVVDYIVATYGFTALKRLIEQYRAPRDMAARFAAAFQTSLASFEAGFTAWLRQRVNRINVYLPPNGPEAQAPSTDTDALADTLRQRIAAQPRDFQAHLQLGIILQQQRDDEGAIQHLTTARDLLPAYEGTPNPRQLLAQIYETRGDLAAMQRELEALVARQQHAFDASTKLAQRYRAVHDYARAVYYLERAIAVDPYAIEVHRHLAHLAFARADYQRAIKAYNILLALQDTDPVAIHTNLAEAYLLDGQKQRAKTAALAALEIAPTFERAQTILLQALAPESRVK